MENEKQTKRRPGILVFLSVFVISASILMLEIGLTRFFSVMFDSHYAFLVISLGVLGLGVGGMYVYIRYTKSKGPNRELTLQMLAKYSGLMALSTSVMTILLVELSIFHNIFFASLLAFFPFLFGGMFFAAAFRLFPQKSTTIYAFDLIGASLGAFLIIIALKIGGINVNLLIGAIASLPAGVLLCRIGSPKWGAGFLCLTAVLFGVFVLNYFSNFLGPVPLVRGGQKDMAHHLAHPAIDASVIESRWSAFGRTDLVAYKNDPDAMTFFIDGAAGAGMHRFDGDLNRLEDAGLGHFPGVFPFKLLQENEKEKVMIIGAGGGRDVLIALLGGSKEITAVEVNPDIGTLMEKYSGFNGGIYDGFPGVTPIIREGRNYIRATKEIFDIIMLSIPVTKTSRSPEGYALTENFLFTVESMSDYLDRLKPDGRIIVIAHSDLEIYRLILTSLSALEKRGISHAAAMERIYTLGPKMLPIFVLKKSPITPEEAQNIHQKMHEHNYSSDSAFIPFVEQMKHVINMGDELFQEHYMLNQALYLISQGEMSADELSGLADYDLKAVTDDDPFFYKFELGIPSILTTILVLSITAMVIGWMTGWGSGGKRVTRYDKLLFLLFFSSLGAGFMLIEISLFQKFILFLGQPVYSVSVLLSSLLVGAGIGSWTSGVILKKKTVFKIRYIALIVALFVILYVLFLDKILISFLGISFASRILISFSLLMPMGFFLGMPFPLGLKLLDESGLKHFVPGMWGINGIASVLGSTLAIVVAILAGFTFSLLIGAVLYFLIFVIFSKKWTPLKSGYR